jgi:hypothetical protein
VVDGTKKEQNKRRKSRDQCEMIESEGQHPASEIVAYHSVRRRFLNLKDIGKEDMNELIMWEFNGQDFELVHDKGTE